MSQVIASGTFFLLEIIMLGSHNTFTYKSPKWFIFKLFSHYWRCQEKTINELYDEGVRYFDIRVRAIKDGYQVCHGIIDVDKQFYSLIHILTYLGINYPNSICRIVLERGNSEKFKSEVDNIKDFKNIQEIIIKKPWTIIYKKENALPIIEYNFELWNWKMILKGIFHNIIKEKDEISKEEAIKDETTIHLMDYV